MRILYINHYAGGPRYGMEFRPYYLSREWVKNGHEVLVVAASFSHVRAKQPEVAGQPLEEVQEGIRFRWYPTPAYVGNGIGRVRNMLAFLIWLYRDAQWLAQEFEPDVVIASSTYPMDIWPARKIAKLAKAKLVFEVHDLWPLSPIELGGMSRWHPFILWVKMAEDAAYCKTDMVMSMLPKARTYMESRGLAPDKIHIIPNGIVPEDWEPSSLAPLSEEVLEVLLRLKAEGFEVVGYAGAHGVANALNNLLDVADRMREDRVAFVMVGGGPDKSSLQRRVATEQLNNVWFLDPVQKTQVPALLACFDIAYIGLQQQPLFRFGIAPNKLMDYMMAARPVLMAIDAGNDPVAEAECGITVTPEDPEAAVRGIRQLLALSEEERMAMGERGRKYVIANHAYSILADRFMTALE